MFKSMKRVFSIATLVALLSLSTGAAAQTVFGGEIISPVNMSHMEAAKFSQTEQSFLSARVSAMGGAFTSLGADLSSMAINPAGLGMYRSSALSFSMSFDNTRSTNGNVNYATNKSQTSFNQVGAALNLYQGTGSLVSFTLGFAYNQLADLNYRNSASWNNGEVTIGEFFAEPKAAASVRSWRSARSVLTITIPIPTSRIKRHFSRHSYSLPRSWICP